MHAYKGCGALHTGMTRSSIYVRCYCLPHGCQCPGYGGESSICGHLCPPPEVSSSTWELCRGAGDMVVS